LNKHTILFLAANPVGTDRLALDEEARAIQAELERSGHHDKIELVTRWAAQPMDLLDRGAEGNSWQPKDIRIRSASHCLS
jgi:hypothetical protein